MAEWYPTSDPDRSAYGPASGGGDRGDHVQHHGGRLPADHPFRQSRKGMHIDARRPA